MTAADRFHAHLDDCARCRERPFDLCPLGAGLLRSTGADIGVTEDVAAQGQRAVCDEAAESEQKENQR